MYPNNTMDKPKFDKQIKKGLCLITPFNAYIRLHSVPKIAHNLWDLGLMKLEKYKRNRATR